MKTNMILAGACGLAGLVLGYVLNKAVSPAANKPVSAISAPATKNEASANSKYESLFARMMLSDLDALAEVKTPSTPNPALPGLVEEALAEDSKSLRLARLGWLFEQMTVEDLPSIHSIFGNLYAHLASNRTEETAIFQEHWAALEGIACFNRWDADGNGWPEGRTLLAKDVISTKPELAEQLLREADQFMFPAEIRKGVVLGLVDKDLQGARSFLVRHGKDLSAADYAPEIMESILRKRGIHVATTWLKDSLAAGLDPAFREGAIETLAGAANMMSPDAWVRFVSNSEGSFWPGEAEMEIAAEKLSAQPEKKKGDNFPIWQQLIVAWVKRDITDVTTWLQAQTGTSHHDIAVAAFVTQVKAINPEVAQQWEDTIRDKEIKILLVGRKDNEQDAGPNSPEN